MRIWATGKMYVEYIFKFHRAKRVRWVIMHLKMKHHIKGIVIVLIAASLSGVSSAEDKVKIVPEKSRTLSTPNGRFVLGQISDWRRDQYLLDTQTGRLWQSSEMTDEKGQTQPVFRIVLIQGADGKLGQLP